MQGISLISDKDFSDRIISKYQDINNSYSDADVFYLPLQDDEAENTKSAPVNNYISYIDAVTVINQYLKKNVILNTNLSFLNKLFSSESTVNTLVKNCFSSPLYEDFLLEKINSVMATTAEKKVVNFFETKISRLLSTKNITDSRLIRKSEIFNIKNNIDVDNSAKTVTYNHKNNTELNLRYFEETNPLSELNINSKGTYTYDNSSHKLTGNFYDFGKDIKNISSQLTADSKNIYKLSKTVSDTITSDYFTEISNPVTRKYTQNITNSAGNVYKYQQNRLEYLTENNNGDITNNNSSVKNVSDQIKSIENKVNSINNFVSHNSESKTDSTYNKYNNQNLTHLSVSNEGDNQQPIINQGDKISQITNRLISTQNQLNRVTRRFTKDDLINNNISNTLESKSYNSSASQNLIYNNQGDVQNTFTDTNSVVNNKDSHDITSISKVSDRQETTSNLTFAENNIRNTDSTSQTANNFSQSVLIHNDGENNSDNSSVNIVNARNISVAGSTSQTANNFNPSVLIHNDGEKNSDNSSVNIVNARNISVTDSRLSQANKNFISNLMNKGIINNTSPSNLLVRNNYNSYNNSTENTANDVNSNSMVNRILNNANYTIRNDSHESFTYSSENQQNNSASEDVTSINNSLAKQIIRNQQNNSTLNDVTSINNSLANQIIKNHQDINKVSENYQDAETFFLTENNNNEEASSKAPDKEIHNDIEFIKETIKTKNINETTTENYTLNDIDKLKQTAEDNARREITDTVTDTINSSIDRISDKVYKQIAARLKTEKIRRGMI